jgi:predicted RNA-binding protein Jag
VKQIQILGRTYEEALEKALGQIKVDESGVDVEVLKNEEDEVILKVTTKYEAPEEAKEVVEFLRTLLEDYFGIKCKIDEPRVSEYYIRFPIVISDHNESLYFVRRRGEVLDSLETIVAAVFPGAFSDRRIFVDVNGYQWKKERELVKEAKEVKERVKREKSYHVFPPMKLKWREFIYTVFDGDEDLIIRTVGDEFDERQVVVIHKDYLEKLSQPEGVAVNEG